MTDEYETWARELVRKIVEAERMGGGFRLYHETAVKEIVEKLRSVDDPEGIRLAKERFKK